MWLKKYKLNKKIAFPFLVPLTNMNLRNKVKKCQSFI